MNGLWRIDEGGNITAQSVETQKLTVGGGATSGVTIYDRQTTAPKCIYIEGGVIKTSDGACGQTTNAGAPAEIIPASAPVPAVTAPVATSTPATTATTTPTVEPVATTTPILAATSTLAVVPAIEPVATTTAPMIILETATTTP